MMRHRNPLSESFVANPKAYNPGLQINASYVANSSAYNPINNGKNIDIIDKKKIMDHDGTVNKNEVTLQYIIREKPKPKILRKYMKTQLDSIKSEEVLLFENNP